MSGAAWEVELTPQAERWYVGLKPRDAERIAAAFDQLERQGPQLGRPTADSVKGSRHQNMKELRSFGGNLRALFAFDPRRHAIVLLGGDKTNDWRGWYQRNIPAADRLYDDHLRKLGKTAEWQPTRTGKRSAGRDR
jgi:hypothetical protein